MFYFNESDIEKKLDELIASKFETEVTEPQGKEWILCKK